MGWLRERGAGHQSISLLYLDQFVSAAAAEARNYTAQTDRGEVRSFVRSLKAEWSRQQ